jgi:hypothetical protein
MAGSLLLDAWSSMLFAAAGNWLLPVAGHTVMPTYGGVRYVDDARAMHNSMTHPNRVGVYDTDTHCTAVYAVRDNGTIEPIQGQLSISVGV